MKNIGEHIVFCIRRHEFELQEALKRASVRREFDVTVNTHCLRTEAELQLTREALKEVQELYA